MPTSTREVAQRLATALGAKLVDNMEAVGATVPYARRERMLEAMLDRDKRQAMSADGGAGPTDPHSKPRKTLCFRNSKVKNS